MDKVDLRKIYKTYYSAKVKPEVVELESANYLSIEGKGDPSGEDFAKKVEAVYSVAFALKFLYKSLNMDFVVAKLEGQWYFNEQKYPGISMQNAPEMIPRSEWNFRLLIRQPHFVQKKLLNLAIENVLFKKQLELANNVNWYEISSRKVLQMLHVGPFDKEHNTLNTMKKFMDGKKLKTNGYHHEIYLSDFRRTTPEKLRTILRETVV